MGKRKPIQIRKASPPIHGGSHVDSVMQYNVIPDASQSTQDCSVEGAIRIFIVH
jgi:hypothetical protein